MCKTMFACLLIPAALPLLAADVRPDLLLADFEGTNYGDWRVEGAAFGTGPAQGTLPNQMEVSGYGGHGLANSYRGGDGTTGKLTSPEFKIERNFITFLIGGGGWADQTCFNLVVGTSIVRSATGPNTAPGGSEELTPRSWAVGEWAGRSARLEIMDAATGGWGHINVDDIAQSDRAAPAAPPPEELYRERLRGQFHFSARRGWLNDPNGLVYSGGEYHLYFQHNPFGWSWGNMHWGHATSADLVHWQEQPIAIYPHQQGDWAYSGSAVVDRDNTSGWRTGTNELIVAAYTSTARGECIVYSNDRGRSFTEFAGNPVVKHAGRDPRLLWHAASRQWVMAVYDEFEGGKYIAFHTSPDLKAWTFRSRIAGFYECPDLFELPLADGTKWVLTAASSEYLVGQFDGVAFKPETAKLTGHRGRGFYAAQTFSHDPHGRIVQMGWLQTETRGMPFNQSMSIPSELKLAATPDGPRLTWTPVKELESLRAASHHLGPMTLAPGQADPLSGVTGELLEIRADFEAGAATEIVFSVRGATIAYDTKNQELLVNGHRAPAPLRGGRQQVVIYVDRTALEIFASDGLTYVPFPFIARPEDQSIGVSVKGGSAAFSSIDVHELKSAWEGAVALPGLPAGG